MKKKAPDKESKTSRSTHIIRIIVAAAAAVGCITAAIILLPGSDDSGDTSPLAGYYITAARSTAGNELMVIEDAGSYTDINEDSVRIDSDGVTLASSTLSYAEIGASVGDGSVTLSDSSIDTLIINGGGQGSVYLSGGSYGLVISNDEDCHIIIAEGTTVDQMSAPDSSLIDLYGTVDKLIIYRTTYTGDVTWDRGLHAYDGSHTASLSISSASSGYPIFASEGSIETIGTYASDRITMLSDDTSMLAIEIIQPAADSTSASGGADSESSDSSVSRQTAARAGTAATTTAVPQENAQPTDNTPSEASQSQPAADQPQTTQPADNTPSEASQSQPAADQTQTTQPADNTPSEASQSESADTRSEELADSPIATADTAYEDTSESSEPVLDIGAGITAADIVNEDDTSSPADATDDEVSDDGVTDDGAANAGAE